MKPVENHRHLYRDPKNSAIINFDDGGYAAYQQLRNNRLREQNEIENLKNDISEIKNVLKTIVSNMQINSQKSTDVSNS